jgi:1-acyl-sn-glycerol-3-phosphate acyltransferase
MRNFWYNVIRSIFNIFTYGLLGMKVYGEENIPKQGPFILASNHASNFDPPLIGTAVKHHLIHFMAKEELFHNPVMRCFFRYIQAFPVHRGHIDRMAIKESFHILQMGGVLGIFPQGTRVRPGNLGRFHEGMAAIALKSRAVVLPTAIIGSWNLPKKKGPLLIVFGKPIVPDTAGTDKQAIQVFNDKVKCAIADLIDQYGGSRYEGN